jgi:hypothetical protein
VGAGDTVAGEGWAPVSLYSPYTGRLDTRWTVITDEHSLVRTVEMQLRELREGEPDLVVRDYHVVQQDGVYVSAVPCVNEGETQPCQTTDELSLLLEGLELSQAARLVVSVRATNYANLTSTIDTTVIRVDATEPGVAFTHHTHHTCSHTTPCVSLVLRRLSRRRGPHVYHRPTDTWCGV